MLNAARFQKESVSLLPTFGAQRKGHRASFGVARSNMDREMASAPLFIGGGLGSESNRNILRGSVEHTGMNLNDEPLSSSRSRFFLVIGLTFAGSNLWPKMIFDLRMELASRVSRE